MTRASPVLLKKPANMGPSSLVDRYRLATVVSLSYTQVACLRKYAVDDLVSPVFSE